MVSASATANNRYAQSPHLCCAHRTADQVPVCTGSRAQRRKLQNPSNLELSKVRGPVFVQTRFPFKIAWFKCLVGPQEWIQGSPFSGDMHSESLPRQTPASTVNQYNTNRRSLLPLAIPSGPSRSKILQLDLDSSRMGRKTIQKQT